jgi:hypothetical protein
VTYLRERVLELVDELEGDILVSISEAIHNQRIAERLKTLVEETDRLDDR